MRKEMFGQLFVAVLCTCAATTMLTAQEDPNVPWDPAAHLRPFWTR